MSERQLVIPCSCGCAILKADYWDDDPEDMLFLDYYVSAFYRDQPAPWYNFKTRLRFLWTILIGRDFIFHELILNKDDVANLKEFVNSL